MNILFHITTGLGAAVLLTDTRQTKKGAAYKQVLPIAIMGFFVGIIAHGALDYIPHCYPINSKLDILGGAFSIIILFFFSRERYKWIVLASLIGCIFPDLVDLLPTMLNQTLGWNLPEYEKIFPWHWKKYSGSIYSGDCSVSFVNHILVIIIVVFMFLIRRNDLFNMFKPLKQQ